VKIVSEELSALVASVTIINAKERALGPIVNFTFFALRFHNVQYDSYSVLIVVSYDPLIGICTVCSYDSIPLGRIFCRLIAGKH
jgi:hypothetical protein